MSSVSKPFVMIAAVAGMSLAMAGTTRASQFEVVDLNSSVQFDTTDPRLTISWMVDQAEQLFAQSFFISLDTVGGQAQQNLLDLDPTPSVVLTNEDRDAGNEVATVTWTGAPIQVEIMFQLAGSGAGSGDSRLNENIELTNLSPTETLNLRLFQYVDLNLSNTPNDDTVNIASPMFNTAVQSDPLTSVAESVTTPAPSGFEVGLTTDHPNLWDRLTGQTLVELGTIAGPVTGDAAWAFQWDFTLAPGGQDVVSKIKTLHAVPEPASLALLGAGLLLMVQPRRRT